MYIPAGYSWGLLHWPVLRNVLQEFISCVLDPEMPLAFLRLVLATEAEVSPVDLQARVE